MAICQPTILKRHTWLRNVLETAAQHQEDEYTQPMQQVQ